MSSYPNHGSGNHNSQEEFQSIPFATSDSISKESNSAKSSRTQVPLHLTEEEMAHAHEIFAEERQRAKEERASHHNSQTSMPNRSTSSQPTYFTSPRNIGSASSSHRMPSLPSKGSAGNLNGFSGMVHGSPLQTSPTFSPSAEETSKSGGNKSATRSSRSPSMADQSSTSRSSGRGIRLTDEDIEIAKRIFAEERVSAAGSSRNASLTGGIGGRSFNGSMSKPFASRPSSTHSRGASAGPRSLARSHSEGNLSTTSRRSGRGLHLTDEDVEIAKRIFAEEHLSAAGSSRRGSMANRSITSNSSKHPHNQSCSSRPSSSRQAASAGRTRGSNSSAPTRPQPRQVKTTIRPPKTSTKRSKPTKPTAAKAPPSKASSGEGSTGLTRDRVRRLSSQKHSPRDHRIQRWQDDHHTPSESSQHASLSVGSANPSSLDSSKAVPPTTNKAAPSTQKMRNNDKKEVNVSTHKVRRASPAKRSSTRSSNNSTPKIPAAVKTAPKPPAPRVVKAPRSRPSIPHAPSNPSTSPPRTASIPARTPSKVLHRRVTSSSSRRSNPSQLPSTTSLRSPSPLDCTNEQHRMTPEQRPPHKMKLAPRSSSSSSKNMVSRNSSLDKKIRNNNSKNNITKPSVKKKKKLRSKHEAPPTSLPPLTDVERMVDDEEDFHGTGVEETVEAAEPKPPSEIAEGGVDDVSEWMDDGFDPPSMMFEPLVPGEDDDSPPRVKQLMAAANASPSPPPNTTSSTHSSIGASSPTPSKDLPNNSSNSNKHVGLRRTTAASVKGTSISVLGNSNVSQAEMVTSTALHNAAAALPDVPKPKRRKRSGERSGEATASSAEHSASLPSPNVVKKKKKKKNQNHPDQQQPQSPNAMKTADQQPRNSVATPISPASNPSTKMPSPTNQPPHGNFADPASIPSTSSSTRAEKKASQQRRTSSAASDPSDHSPTASRKQLPMHRNSADPNVASTPSTASSTREKTNHQQQPMRKTSSPQSIPPSPPSSRSIQQRQAHPSHISASSPTPAVTTRHASGEKAAAEVPHINHNPYMVEDADGVPVDDFAMEQLILSPEDSPRGSTTGAGASKLTATQHPLTTDDSAQTVAAPAPRPSYVRSLLLNSVTLDSSRWSDGSDQPPSKNERCPAHDLPAEVAKVATPTKKKKSKKKKAADPGESSEVVNPAEAVVLPVLRATEVMAPHPPASPHSPQKQRHRHRGVSPIPRPKSKHQGSDALPPIVTKEAAAVEEAATPRQQHRESKPSPPARPQRSMRVIEMSSTESSPTSSRCGSSYSVLLFIEPYEQRSSGVRLRPVR